MINKMEGIFESNSLLGEREKIMTTSNNLEDGCFESNWKNEEEDEENGDSNEETNVNHGGFINMFSMLSITSPTKDNGSTISSHIKIARDYLSKRHLISRSEMENFGEEDVQFCVWRLESRLGQVVIKSHREWKKY